jgi:hypothetical protein
MRRSGELRCNHPLLQGPLGIYNYPVLLEVVVVEMDAFVLP